jgi:RHS repeat-associated protein
MGNLVNVLDPNGSEGIYEYDANNRLIKMNMNQGIRRKNVQFSYDEAGYRTWVKDDGVEIYFNNAEERYLPAPDGHITRETLVLDGKVFSTEYSYDVVGRIQEIRYPSGETLKYEYNKVGEVTHVPGYLLEGTICYDRGGVLESAQAANGVDIRWERDGNGRLIGLGYYGGKTKIKEYSFTYDEADNVIWKNGNRYVYDEMNQLLFEHRTDNVDLEQRKRVGWVEDDFFGGKSLEFVVRSTTVALDYASSSIGVDLGLDVNVNRIELVPGVGNPVSRVYNNRNCILVYKSESNDEGDYSKLLEYSVNTKENGIIELLFSSAQTARFLKIHCGYDDRDENLSPVNRSEFQNRAEDLIRVYAYLDRVGEEEFVYDGAGNRTSERITEGETVGSYTESTYTNTNRLKCNGRFAFRYDSNGNMVQKGTNYKINGDLVTIYGVGEWWDFEYDFLNRLVEVKKNGKTAVSYMYDGLGRKVKKVGKQSGTTYYVSSPEGRLLYEEKGKRYREHKYVFGEIFARVDGEIGNPRSRTINFFHTDNMGSVTAVTDGTGTLIWSCEYSAFGKPIGERGRLDAVPVFAGKEYDEEARLYYFDARWYDPDNGRFISEDPAQDGLNWFIYAGNNPLTYRDPTGLKRDRGGGGGNGSSNRSERQSDRQERRDQRQETRQENKEQRQERKEARQDQREERKQERRNSREERKEARRLEKGENGGIDYPDIFFDVTSLLLMQFDLSLNPYDGFRGLFRDKSMAKYGCHLRALQAFAETYVGIPLTAKQIREARRDLREQGIIGNDLKVKDNAAVINDAFSRLGHPELVASVTEYSDNPPGFGEADGTLVRGTNPISKDEMYHSQLGDSAGNTLWDPGYRTPVDLGTMDKPKQYRYITVTK